MKVCELCEEHPAVNDGMCIKCHEDMVSFEKSPEGVVLRILKQILSAAEEGGLMVRQSNAIAVKVLRMIARTEGTLCGCPECDGTVTVDDICDDVIGHVEDIISEFREFGCDDDAE